MDIDLSNSDMSRLTTMLTNAGAPFAREYAAGGERTIEVGTTEFYFDKEGALVRVKIPPRQQPAAAPIGSSEPTMCPECRNTGRTLAQLSGASTCPRCGRSQKAG